MKGVLKLIVKTIILIIIWIIVCLNPWLLFPLFLCFPLIKLFLFLGLSNAFMSDTYDCDKRKHNRFHISDDFVAGATVVNAINQYNKK